MVSNIVQIISLLESNQSKFLYHTVLKQSAMIYNKKNTFDELLVIMQQAGLVKIIRQNKLTIIMLNGASDVVNQIVKLNETIITTIGINEKRKPWWGSSNS